MYNLYKKKCLRSILVELKCEKFSLLSKVNFKTIINFEHKKSNKNKKEQN